MYYAASVRRWLELNPVVTHRSSELLTALAPHIKGGAVVSSAVEAVLGDLAPHYMQACELDRDLMTYGADEAGIKLVEADIELVPRNFPHAKHGDVVVEGRVSFVFGGIPGKYRFDTDVVMRQGEPTMYWSAHQLLRGWGGYVQVVMHVDTVGVRSIKVRRKRVLFGAMKVGDRFIACNCKLLPGDNVPSDKGHAPVYQVVKSGKRLRAQRVVSDRKSKFYGRAYKLRIHKGTVVCWA